jgi:hypothetical protein
MFVHHLSIKFELNLDLIFANGKALSVNKMLNGSTESIENVM